MSIEIIKAGNRVIEAVINGERVFVDRDVAKARLKKCNHCSHNSHGRCDVCKCFITLKKSLTTEGCPLGYWHT